MLETLLALGREKEVGLLPRDPLALSVMKREVASWAHPIGVPVPRKALFAPAALLALLGRLLEYGIRYPGGTEAAQR